MTDLTPMEKLVFGSNARLHPITKMPLESGYPAVCPTTFKRGSSTCRLSRVSKGLPPLRHARAAERGKRWRQVINRSNPWPTT